MSSNRVLFKGKGNCFIGVVFLSLFSHCALLTTRPVQEMSYTAASLRAAKEVQADTLAPELLRQANEAFFHAKHEYRLKNFYAAKKYALKARKFAEMAEFESIRNGGGERAVEQVSDPYSEGFQRNSSHPPPPSSSEPAPSVPYSYPQAGGIPADNYEQRKAEEDQRKFELEKIRAQPAPVISNQSGPVLFQSSSPNSSSK